MERILELEFGNAINFVFIDIPVTINVESLLWVFTQKNIDSSTKSSIFYHI